MCFLSSRERHDFSQSIHPSFSNVHPLTASRSPCSLYALVLPRQTPFRFHYMSDAIALKVNHRHCVIVTRITKQNVGVRFASDSSKRGPRLLWYMGSSHLVSAISCDRVQPTQAAGLDSAEPGGPVIGRSASGWCQVACELSKNLYCMGQTSGGCC